MKVVKPKPFYSFTCAGCKSKLEAEPSDLLCSLAWEGSYCGSNEYFYVVCPICELKESIPGDRQLPSKLEDEARAEARRKER